MQALEVGRRRIVGANVLPPGESGFIQHLPDGSGLADLHMGDQAELFRSYTYQADAAAIEDARGWGCQGLAARRSSGRMEGDGTPGPARRPGAVPRAGERRRCAVAVPARSTRL